LLAPRPTPKLEDCPLSDFCDNLFNIFAATLILRGRFLHPHPKDAPRRGDRDSQNWILTNTVIISLNKQHTTREYVEVEVPINIRLLNCIK